MPVPLLLLCSVQVEEEMSKALAADPELAVNGGLPKKAMRKVCTRLCEDMPADRELVGLTMQYHAGNADAGPGLHNAHVSTNSLTSRHWVCSVPPLHAAHVVV